MYWVGLGMRSAFLPDAAAALEVGGSWRTLETVLVPGAWAMAGLLVTPWLLRRMAGRQSGFAGRGRDARGDAVGQVSRSALVRPNCRFPLAFPSFPVSSRTRLDITSGPSPFARPRRLRRTVAQSRMDVRDRPVAPTSLRGTGELR
jgi:hypothetical protein